MPAYTPEDFRAWGASGGRKRKKRLTRKRRKEIATLAANARWAKRQANGAN